MEKIKNNKQNKGKVNEGEIGAIGMCIIFAIVGAFAIGVAFFVEYLLK